jgi:menaquinone-dependent protoporphyrinogen oxidase
MRVLIAVASKHGSTAQLGEVVAERLRARGAEAVVVPAAEITDVGGYDGVVVGAAVYAGRLVPSARALAARWGKAIAGRANYLFVSGPLADEPDAPPPDAAEIAAALGSRLVASFPGRAVDADLGATERAVLRMKGARTGDYRDFADVGAWADRVAADLDAALARPVPSP